MTKTSQEPPLGDHCARFSARPPGRFPRGTGGLASCARPLPVPTPAGPRDAPAPGVPTPRADQASGQSGSTCSPSAPRAGDQKGPPEPSMSSWRKTQEEHEGLHLLLWEDTLPEAGRWPKAETQPQLSGADPKARVA